MAYDEWLAERIDHNLAARKVVFETKKMMGGLCYLVDGKMLMGIVRDQLMCRIGVDVEAAAHKKDGVHEMTFTGRTMKGYVFVDQEAVDEDVELDYWIQLCLNFNPMAKSSKKKA